MTNTKSPLWIGAYRVYIETDRFGAGYVVRRSDRPALGHCYPTMALAIHHARRLNRKYPQRSIVSTSSQEALP